MQHLERNTWLPTVFIWEHAVFCCVCWEMGSTCHRVPTEGVTSGRYRQQLNLFVAQFRLSSGGSRSVDPLECSVGRICLLAETLLLVFAGWRLLLIWGLCIFLALFCRAKQGSLSRHVLSDAVVGGSHVVNRSWQRYFHNTCLCYQRFYNVLHTTAACTVTKVS